MAYNPYINPYFGQQNYQNNMQMPQQMVGAQMSQPAQDERIWVQSATAAENYLVAPNSFVRLWDSTAPRFYERRSDATGRPFPMETYEYKKVNASSNTSDEFLTHFKALEMRIDALERKVGGQNEQSNANDSAV